MKRPISFLGNDGVNMCRGANIVARLKIGRRRVDGDVKDAAKLMRPPNEKLLQKWQVSKRVNSSRADGDDATLIEQIKLET